MLTGENFVGYSRSAKGSSVFQTFNPVRNAHLPTKFVEANEEEIYEACALAKEAFFILNQLPFQQRANFLREVSVQITEAKEQIINLYCLESGLSSNRALAEFERTINQIHLFADYLMLGTFLEVSIDTGDMHRNPPKPDLRKMMVGIGPVVVFGASNFPLAYSTAGGDTISAFAAGCPVIVKSHPLHTGTGELVASCITRAAKKTGMPEGVFSNLNGKSYKVGNKLVVQPEIRAVSFTGSEKGGRALYDLAASRKEPIPVFAEMGSVNPIIILPSAFSNQSKNWAEIIAESVTNDAGQFCTKPGVIFVLDSFELESFIWDLKVQIAQKHNFTMLHPEMKKRYVRRLEEVANCFGVYQQFSTAHELPNAGVNVISSCDIEYFLLNDELHEEVFGPHALVVKCAEIKDVLAGLNKIGGQLTCSIIGSTEEFVIQSEVISVIREKAGRLIFNGMPTGVEVNSSSNHGGPYPASTDCRFTAVGVDSIKRFCRPVVYQNCPNELLPMVLKNKNLLKIARRVNGKIETKDIDER